MNDLTSLLMVASAGMLLGALFFGGLWWTVRRALASPRPAQWFAGSLLLRLALALGGFYYAAGGDWRRLLACLLGFVVARIIVTRLTALPTAKEAGHAP